MSLPASSISTPSASPFIRLLPLEIRRQIYKLLLVNPVLGTIEAVKLSKRDRPRKDLSIEILKICRQIYREASEILYDQTFAVNCTGKCSGVVTPLSELPYFEPSEGAKGVHIRVNRDTLRKVRSWNIFIYAYDQWHTENEEFKRICQVICYSRPRQVNIIVWRQPIEAHIDPTTLDFGMKPWELMRPLINLRNIGLLRFGHLKRHLYFYESGGVLTNAYEEGKAIDVYGGVGSTGQRMLKKLAEGNSPVERSYV
jgi:hypothetical protein